MNPKTIYTNIFYFSSFCCISPLTTSAQCRFVYFLIFFYRATLKKTTDDIELKENRILQMKEQMHQMQTDTANNVHLLQAYLLESDRENEELREKTTDLKTHLSNVIGRVFSSEIRRVELEKSFGGLSKPSPGKVKIQNAEWSMHRVHGCN